jgi:uncharacterized protein (TIGR02145 family)
MMVDGKYADESKMSSAWDESWVSDNYFNSGAPGTTANADKNNARGETSAKDGGRGICPMGWHVPTDYEWANMLDKVEGDGTGTTYTADQTDIGWHGSTDPTISAGVKLKSSATYSNSEPDPGNGAWTNHPNRGTNSTGFGAVPGGNRHFTGLRFGYRGSYACYWTSSVGSTNGAWGRMMLFNYAQVHRFLNNRTGGNHLRCVKD